MWPRAIPAWVAAVRVLSSSGCGLASKGGGNSLTGRFDHRSVPKGAQRAIGVGITCVESLRNSKRSSQFWAVLGPCGCGGANFHPCAACIDRRAKYLLGPVESKRALDTLPSLA